MKILVAIDSSAYADEIFSEISTKTWPKGTTFRVATVVEPSNHWDVDQPIQHQAKVILDDHVARLRRKLPDTVTASGDVMEGKPDAVILKLAGEWQADLIIIGSHGDTGVRREGLGSIAAAIVNDAPCSVEVVKIPSKKLLSRK